MLYLWQNWVNPFLNSNFFLALVSVAVGLVAYRIYQLQLRDRQRDAAAVVLQEIRRAEDIISSFRPEVGFQFVEKVIASNSWSSNIHLFVRKLSIDELDKISALYSLGTKIDEAVAMSFDATYSKGSFDPVADADTPPAVGGGVAVTVSEEVRILQLALGAFFQESVSNYHPIYHSAIGTKLKAIANVE